VSKGNPSKGCTTRRDCIVIQYEKSRARRRVEKRADGINRCAWCPADRCFCSSYLIFLLTRRTNNWHKAVGSSVFRARVLRVGGGGRVKVGPGAPRTGLGDGMINKNMILRYIVYYLFALQCHD